MPLQKDVQRMLLRAKAEGKLKPEYLRMTDEDYLLSVEKRLQSRQKRTGTPSKILLFKN